MTQAPDLAPAAPAATPAPRPGARWRTVLRWWLFFTALALLTSIQQMVTMRAEGEAATWQRVLVSRVPYWYLWAVLAPLVIRFGRRVPLTRERLGRAVATHLAAAVLLSTVHATLYFAVWLLAGSTLRGSLVVAWSTWAGGLLFSNLIAYGAVLGGSLALAYHDLFREREVAASRLAEQLATARLHALRMQLNPHFLFNAMNSIAMLVRRTRNDEAVRMLAGLSALLRHVLEEGQAAEVSLGEELDFVRRYLAIEEVRFQDRLRVAIDVDPGVLDARVPNLLLQPIVENAIRHGLARRVGAGLVEIVARREGERLVVTVRDDGPGLAAPGVGVGISNTRARLAQRFGDAGRFALADHPDGGAVATISLPLVRGQGPAPAGAPDAAPARIAV